MGFAGEYVVFTLGSRKSPRVLLHYYENEWLVHREALKFVEVVEQKIGDTTIHLIGQPIEHGGRFVEVQCPQVAPVAMGRTVERVQQKARRIDPRHGHLGVVSKTPEVPIGEC
jgi:hypothetical protein